MTYVHLHRVEKREFLSHRIIKQFFREINSLVISIVKTLLSRNFCQSACETESKFTLTEKNFVKSTIK